MVDFLLKTDVIVTIFIAVAGSVLFVNMMAAAMRLCVKFYMYIEDIR